MVASSAPFYIMHSGKSSIEDRRNKVAPGDLQGSSIEHSILHHAFWEKQEDRRNQMQDTALKLEDNFIGFGAWSLPSVAWLVLHGQH